MKITDITLTLESVANDSSVLVVEVNPYKEYADGKPTDKVGGFRYACIAPSNKYAAFSIKVAEKKPAFTQEEIDANGGEITATPINFVGRFYRNNSGEYLLSAKADSMKQEVTA